MNKTKTMSDEEYNKEHGNKTKLIASLPYVAVVDIVNMMKKDPEPTFEFTAKDENTEEEFLISLELRKKKA